MQFKKRIFLLLALSLIFTGIKAQVPYIQWQKNYGGSSYDEAVSVKNTSTGFVIAGSTTSINNDVTTSLGNYDIFVISIDFSGNILWKTVLGTDSSDFASDVENTLDGNIIVSGFTNKGINGGRDMYVAKLDGSTGTVIWENNYGSNGLEQAKCVFPTQDGGYLVAGSTNSYQFQRKPGYSGYDFWVIKLNSIGGMVWQKSYGGLSFDEVRDIEEQSNTDIVLTGLSYSNDLDFSTFHNGSTSTSDIILLTLDQFGNLTSKKNFGGSSNDIPSSVHQTPDLGYIVAGTSFSNDVDITGHHGPTTTSDCWVFKLDNTGSMTWEKSFGGGSLDGANEIQVTGTGYIFTGYVLSSDGDVSFNHQPGKYDYWLVNIDNTGALVWEKTYGGSNNDKAFSFAQTPDAGYIMAGFTESQDQDVLNFYGDHDFWIAKAGGTCIPPATSFTASADTVCLNTKVIFTNTTPKDNITQYVWKINGTLFSNGKDTSKLFTAPGNYVITLDAYKGPTCSASAVSKTITVNPTLTKPVITPSGTVAFCEGSSVILTSSASNTYQWYLNNSAIGGATTQTYNATGSAGTYKYHVIITDRYGCTAQSLDTTITIYPLPPSNPVYPSNPEYCQGDSVKLQATTGFSYTWSTGSTNSFIYAKAGTYTVTLTSSNGCVTVLPPVTVNENPKPFAGITTSGSTDFCKGGSVSLNAPAGMTKYVWSIGLTTQSITVGDSARYSVTVTDINGCKNSSDTLVKVHAFPKPAITPGGPTQFCAGGSVVLSANGANSYQWYKNNAVIASATSQNYTAAASGVYTVKETNSFGCSAMSAGLLVKSDSVPKRKLTVFNADSVCPGSKVTIAAPSNLKKYTWNIGDTTQSVTVGAGTYYCTVYSNAGCSAMSDTITIKNRLVPTVSMNPSAPVSICKGNIAKLATSLPFPSYRWNTGNLTDSIYVSTSGTYTVTVTAANGCTASTSNTVTVNPLPDATIKASGPLSYCNGGSVTLTVKGGYSSYTWKNNLNVVVDTDSSYTTGNSSGKFTISITNIYNCSASNSVNIKVNPLPANAKIKASGKTSFCQGDSITLIDSSNVVNATYLWSTGSTKSYISVKQSGTYSMVISNSFGCTKQSNSIGVTVFARPAISITAGGATTFCKGDSVLLSASNATLKRYEWSTLVDTFPNLKVKKSGNYYLRVWDTNNCTNASNSISVNVVPPPSVTITAMGKTRFCMGDSVNLNAGNGFTTYLWSNQGTGQIINVKNSGTYSVTVSNAIGCSNSSSGIKIQVDSVPAIPAITQTLGLLTSSSSLGNQWYLNGNPINGATSKTYLTTQSGDYYVVVTNNNGCSAKSSIIHVVSSGIDDNTHFRNMNLFPNPSSGDVRLSFELLNAGKVKYEVYDLSGSMLIKSVDQGFMVSGNYEILLNDENFGNHAGQFIIKLTVADYSYYLKAVRIK